MEIIDLKPNVSPGGCILSNCKVEENINEISLVHPPLLKIELELEFEDDCSRIEEPSMLSIQETLPDVNDSLPEDEESQDPEIIQSRSSVHSVQFGNPPSFEPTEDTGKFIKEDKEHLQSERYDNFF